LEAIAHNLNRKNNDLRFFEFGKTYHTNGPGAYNESWHLCLYLTGNDQENGWRQKSTPVDFFALKGITGKIIESLGTAVDKVETLQHPKFESGLSGNIGDQLVLQAGIVNKKTLNRFDIKQPVFFADLNWEALVAIATAHKPVILDIPKFPAVHRDLAIIVPTQLKYEEVEKTVDKIRLNKLQSMKLFDIFESEKLGKDKKSLAVSFTFLDEEKTLTDNEIDGWMKKIMNSFEKDLQAEIRK
jgi:phenylalanyl-tRNA synthetase beta chain